SWRRSGNVAGPWSGTRLYRPEVDRETPRYARKYCTPHRTQSMLTSDRVGPAQTGHGPRPWNLADANARLPELRELLPNLRAWVVRLRKLHAERQRLTEFWGKEFEAPDHPDRPLRMRLDEEEREL